MTISTSRPWEGVAASGPVLRTKEAAAYLGISVPGYYQKAAKGLLPSPLKIGGHASGVPVPWLNAVIAQAAAAR